MLQKIFNSLGSNYSHAQARELRYDFGSKKNEEQAKETIKNWLGNQNAQVHFFYKGREALEAGLTAYLAGEGAVAVNGFTCYVVERAIRRAGGEVVFADTGEKKLNFDLKNLQQAYQKNKKIKAVLLQNTFGLEMEELDEIISWCREKKLLVIEDCAHNFGANYQNGKPAGSLGDLVIASFSQDKVFDVISGGCLIVNTPTKLKIAAGELPRVSLSQIKKDKNYGLRTWKIRTFYGIGYGKLLHWYYKKRQMLSNPMQYAGSEDAHQHRMTWGVLKILSKKLQVVEARRELDIRRRRAMVYYQNLPKQTRLGEITPAKIQLGTVVRYPMVLPDKKTRDELVAKLAKKGFLVSDIWYDVLVAPKRYFKQSLYKKRSCPNGEKLTERILNLPTHKNITIRQAEMLTGIIKAFLAK
jgi:dTDP-4-amino-4,6-dideoxygalactose transaminase